MTAKELAPGDMAPDFRLPAFPEGEVELSGLRGKYVVLYFYPKDNTPGCTTESCDFRDSHTSLEKAGAIVLGISRDSLASHKKFADKYSLPFPLLADTEEEVCNAYDVIKMKNMYGKQVRGIERSTFLIDPEGRIAHIWRKVKVKGHVDEVLERLREAQG